MTTHALPERPAIHHITHVENLSRILEARSLRSDRRIRDEGGPAVEIGMSDIKARRLILPVPCHPGDHVGDYVPFYFCPRSIMLYLIYMANHPELEYRGGQAPILHLRADLHTVVRWAEDNDHRWAFTLSNAGANYAEFRASLDDLTDVNWRAVAARDWRDADVREGKQAEFLVHDSFPFELITHIGVHSARVQEQVQMVLLTQAHRPPVTVERTWYY